MVKQPFGLRLQRTRATFRPASFEHLKGISCDFLVKILFSWALVFDCEFECICDLTSDIDKTHLFTDLFF